MKGYFFSVILTAVLGGVATELLPDTSGMRPYIRAVTGFLVLAVLVLPMKEVLLGLGSFFETVELEQVFPGEAEEEAYESIFEDALSRFSGEEAEKSVSALLERTFALKEGTCSVRLTVENGEIRRVLVMLSGRSALTDPRLIEAYVNEHLSCPCDVAVGE